MKRTKLRVLSVLLALCMMGPLTACGPEPEAPEEPVERAEIPHTEPDLTETDELVILAYNVNFGPSIKKYRGTNLEEMFQTLYPDVKITVESNSCIVENPCSSGSYQFLLKKDWGGISPDLIWVSNYSGYTMGDGGITFAEREDTYRDAYELVEAGKLLDLNDLLKADSEVDLSLYDEKMLSAGLYRGGRYFIPLSGSTNATTLLGSREALRAAGFSEDAWKNSITLTRELARIQKEGRYEDVIADDWMYGRLQQAVFDASVESLVDRENGIVTASREELRDFCGAWKELFYTSGQDPQAYTGEVMSGSGIMKDQHLLEFVSANASYTLSGVKTEGTPIYKNFPSIDGTVIGDVHSCLAICADGKNQLNAWRFIKMMLSEDLQTHEALAECTLPVLLSAQEPFARQLLERAQSDAEREFVYGRGASLGPEETEQFRSALMEVDTYRIASPAEFSIFQEQMGPYFRSEGSYEDCVENLKAALRAYLAGE